MKQISGKQFIASEIFLTLGMSLMLCSSDLPLDLAAPLICASSFVLMTPAEHSRPFYRRDAVWIVAGLLVIVVLRIAATHTFSDAAGAAVIRLMRHPAFILPLWFLITWRTCRQWRHAKTTAIAS